MRPELRLTTPAPEPDWICCQLGAREHYAIPSYLHGQGRLRALLTDAWVKPGGPLSVVSRRLNRRLDERYAGCLASAQVRHFTGSLVSFEGRLRLRKQHPAWQTIMARNEWFQDCVVAQFSRSKMLRAAQTGPPTVFAYSYAARRIFQAARAAGCRTVLGQIDPGPFEEEIIGRAMATRGAFQPVWHPAPRVYWDLWREEIELADQVLVNSAWSRDALIARGLPAAKLHILPLCYRGNQIDSGAVRRYPVSFSHDRPLRVLFLGSLIVRKGICEALEAAQLLINAPVEFRFVGMPGVALPDSFMTRPGIQWIGPVTRGDAAKHYREADIFLLPTLSDGFGLTQIEAQSHGLPIIASTRCGAVVEHGQNGLLLMHVTGVAIAEAISWCLSNPAELGDMSQRAIERSTRFRPSAVLDQLVTL